MRIAAAIVLGAVSGALAGFAVSEAIALLGLLLFDRPAGLRHLPIVLGVAGGTTGWVVARRESLR